MESLTSSPPLPSSFLPPIKTTSQLSREEVNSIVTILTQIYLPDVLGTQMGIEDIIGVASDLRATKVYDERRGGYSKEGYDMLSPLGSGESDPATVIGASNSLNISPRSYHKVSNLNQEQLRFLRADEFERAYAMKWLTGLIARSEEWLDTSEDELNSPPSIRNLRNVVDGKNKTEDMDERSRREKVIDRASALLAACSGSAASGPVTRTFTFRPRMPPPRDHPNPSASASHFPSAFDSSTSSAFTPIPSNPTTNPPSKSPLSQTAHEIRIQLKDDAVPAQDQDAVGLQTWGCAPIMAELMCHDLHRFGLNLDARTPVASSGTGKMKELGGEILESDDDGVKEQGARSEEASVQCSGGGLGREDVPTGTLDDGFDDRSARPTLKILELGAGTGLLSIFIWNLVDYQSRRQFISKENNSNTPGHYSARPTIPHVVVKHEVVSTDYHPVVLENMAYNVRLNVPLSSITSPSSSVAQNHLSQTSVRTECLDWINPPTLEEEDKYDLVFGADIVYEKGHAELIRGVVERVMKRPAKTVDPLGKGDDGRDRGGIFWLMYPLRPTHTAESESIERVFDVGYSCRGEDDGGVNDAVPDGRSEAWALGVLEAQSLARKKGIGRGDDEVSYKLLKIGWIGIDSV